MSATRIVKHLFAPDWIVRRAFSGDALRRIEAAIKQSEASHRGELRFAVEAGLELLPLFSTALSSQPLGSCVGNDQA
jgi:hypothetical protein